MKYATISQARNQLSTLLRQVERGSRIPIRRRKRIIAWLIPAQSTTPEGVSIDLVERGLIKLPERKLVVQSISSTPALKVNFDIEAALLRNRDEDR